MTSNSSRDSDYESLFDLMDNEVECTISIIHTMLNDKTISVDLLQDVSLDIIDSNNSSGIRYLSLSIRLENKTVSKAYSNIIYTSNVQSDDSVDPALYLDDINYKIVIDDLNDILDNVSNRLLKKYLDSRKADGRNKLDNYEERDMFNILSTSLNVQGAKFAIEAGYKPSYSSFDNIIKILDSFMILEVDDKYKIVAKNLAKDLLKLYDEHGYELDSTQRYKLIYHIPELDRELSVIENTPQWSRECKVSIGKPTRRLKSLASDIGITKGETKEMICTTLSEFSKKSLEDIMKDGREAMDSSSKLFRILPYERQYSLEPRSQLCYNNVDPSGYTASSMIKYKGYCIAEDDFQSIANTGYIPNTNIELPSDVMNKINDRLNQLNTYGGRGTIKSIHNRLTSNSRGMQEFEQRSVETRFRVILDNNDIDLDLYSMTPEEISDMALEIFEDDSISNPRAFIDMYFSLSKDDRSDTLDLIQAYIQ